MAVFGEERGVDLAGLGQVVWVDESVMEIDSQVVELFWSENWGVRCALDLS